MITFALQLIACLLALAFGAWLMLGALTARPGLETYCVKCGNNLTDVRTEYCTKCRRLLSPEMLVTCTRSTLRPGRLAAGLLVTLVVAIIAALTLSR